jgi:hypothetical protein
VGHPSICYSERVLALALLVLRVLADHPHHTAAMDDLALVTNLFY